MFMILPLGLILVLAVYIVSTYNQLVTFKTRIRASIQEIGNQLKRQSDLIPNLVASVKGYMKHEKEIFSELTAARKAIGSATQSNDPNQIVAASERMQKALSPIMAIFESTPKLQAAEPTAKLMEELRDTADRVMYSRRTLIDLTADYNARILVFPSNLVAGIFGFQAEVGLKTSDSGEHLEVSESETKSPKVGL